MSQADLFRTWSLGMREFGLAHIASMYGWKSLPIVCEEFSVRSNDGTTIVVLSADGERVWRTITEPYGEVFLLCLRKIRLCQSLED